jgi:hypothetical protein
MLMIYAKDIENLNKVILLLQMQLRSVNFISAKKMNYMQNH